MKFLEITKSDLKSWTDKQIKSAILGHGLVWNNQKFPKSSPLENFLNNAEIPENYQFHVAYPDNNDWHEQKITEQLANDFLGENIKCEITKSGRVNFIAKIDGILHFNTENLDKFNELTPEITMATRPYCTQIYQGEIVASCKIIPYFVAGNIVKKSMVLAKKSCLNISPLQGGKAHLIFTYLEEIPPQKLQKSAQIFQKRLLKYNYEVGKISNVRHHCQELSEFLTQIPPKDFDLIAIMGAVSIADINDIVPKALINCGGKIIRYGMPVDPGNLLLLGEISNCPFLGLPGCAKSPKFNGLDFILQRLAARINITSKDIAQLGKIGLLPENYDRGALRAVNYPVASKPLIAILAAGKGERMAQDLAKPLTIFRDKALLEWVIDNINQALPSKDIIIIVNDSPQGKQVQEFCLTKQYKFIINNQYNEGIASSLRLAVNYASQTHSALMVFLADMPNITPKTIATIWQEFQRDTQNIMAVQPKFGSQLGHPVVFNPRIFSELAKLSGDTGAKTFMENLSDYRRIIDTLDAGVIQDGDTKAMINQWSRDYDIVFNND